MPEDVKIKPVPTRDIDFQVDTIPPGYGRNGVFFSNQNAVNVSYKNGKTYIDTLPHEQKHRDNYQAGLYAYAVSPEQAYKLNMHDEISANMAALLVARQEYLETGDLSVFDYNEDPRDGRYEFYKEAVKSGEIKPGSPYQEDFDKEMRFIANQTRDMWIREFRDLYVKQNTSYAVYGGDRSGKYAPYYDENYQRGRKIAYTLGGVDFTQYMDNDVDIPQKGKIALLNLENHQKIAEKMQVPAFDGTMSLEQYQKLVLHQLTVNEMVSRNPEKLKSNYGAAKLLYQQDGEVPDELAQRFKEAANAVSEQYGAQIDALVASAANECGYVPEADDKAYSQAVNKIYDFPVNVDATNLKYHGTVNVRDVMVPDESILNRKLPEKAQKLQNISSWEKTLRNYMVTMGVPAKEAAQKAEVFSQGNKILNGAACFIGAPVEGVVQKVKGWFSSEKAENEPIEDINKKAPQYRKWENKDGSRVSEVQYRKIPDLTKDVIAKPTKSYAAEKAQLRQKLVASAQQAQRPETNRPQFRQEAGQASAEIKTKISRVLEEMNKINGPAAAVDVEAVVDVLSKKYGDKSYELLLKAVNEPYVYAQDVGDGSIRTSRAAVQHLCGAENNIRTTSRRQNLKQKMMADHNKALHTASSGHTPGANVNQTGGKVFAMALQAKQSARGQGL